jgi:type II secretory pathway pseudopilin PulG
MSNGAIRLGRIDRAGRSALRGARRRIAAFTLMEMLVIISIIMLLLSMASPSLSRAKEASRNVKCLANLSELGNSFTAYSDDNRSYLPPYKTPFDPTPKAYWGGLLAQGRYTDPGLPFSCPSYDPPRKDHMKCKREFPETNWFFTQYGINWQFIGSRFGDGLGTGPAGGPVPTPMVTQIRRPSETIFVVDSTGRLWQGSTLESGITFVGPSDTDSTTGAPHARHMGNTGINVLWGDTRATHVKCSIPQNPHTPDALTDAKLAPTNNYWDIK